eukprot:GILJ01028537.1.p1 GENE.GILJ01028537.1~~GILJ01028537.1.p1  ORF type:complete len:185 (-),score=23.54 GILJ01028537.1:50-604(-)
MYTLRAPLQLIAFYWYMVMTVINVFNYIFYYRYKRYLDYMADYYAAFSVIGIAVFILVGGPMFVMSFKYSPTETKRLKYFRLGSAIMFILSATPLFVMSFVHAFSHDLKEPLNGICIIINILTWIVGLFVVWFMYMGAVSKYLHEKSGMQRDIVVRQRLDQLSGPQLPPSLAYAIKAADQPDIV